MLVAFSVLLTEQLSLDCHPEAERTLRSRGDLQFWLIAPISTNLSS
jgi:hypothetical protein